MTGSGTQISISAVRRLVLYHRTLELALERGESSISSVELARRNGVTAVQVRKDLSCFGAFGRRGLGYPVLGLKDELRRILGIDRTRTVIVVGVGNVGMALMAYVGLRQRGFRILAGFDIDPRKSGSKYSGIPVYPMDRLKEVAKHESIDIGVVTVPAPSAQEVCDRLIDAGVSAILNFAPTCLSAPEGVAVRNVDMSTELKVLAFLMSRFSSGTDKASRSTSRRKNRQLMGASGT
jgi:redox-sensing transcriptional repressor